MKTAKFRASRSAKMRLLSLMLIMVMMLSLGFSGLAAAEELTDEPEEPSVETLAEIEEGEAVAEEPEEAGDPDEDMPAEDPAEESDGESQSVSESDPSDKSTDPAPEDAADPDPVEAERPTDPRQGEGLQGLEPVETPVTAMPAQSFECMVGDTLVSAFAPKGALPTGARMVVTAVTDEEILQTIGDTVDAESYRVTAFDITFYTAFGEPVEPQKAVSVTMKAAVIRQSEDPVVVVHMDDSGETEVVEQTKNPNEDEVSFSADSFSIYAIVADTYRLKVIFHKVDGTPQEPIYVKKGDNVTQIVYDAGLGGTLEDGLVYRGWWKSNDYTVANADSAMTITQIRADIETVLNTGLSQDGQEYHVYPMIFKLFTITYFSEKESVLVGSDSILLLPSDASTPYTVNMAYTPSSSEQNFEGWHVKNGGSYIDGWTEGTVYANGTQVTISGSVEFSVHAPTGHWLIFDENGKGATYNAPQFIYSGNVTVEPDPDRMVRNGYTFGGWYDTKAHADAHAADTSVTTGEFEFGHEINDKTTVYASWIPNARAPYTIIFWTQNVGRTGYEVKGSTVVANGVVGNAIPYNSVNNGDEDYATSSGNNFNNNLYGHYTGFCLTEGSKNQSVTITPEGDAVLNLYYDRIEYNFKFYLYRDSGSGTNRYTYANNSGSGSTLNDLVTWHGGSRNHPSTNAYSLQSETHRFNNTNYTYYYFTITAYYGQDISAIWPSYDKIQGADNHDPVSYVMMVGTKLKPTATSSGSGTVKGIVSVLDENILGKTNDSNGNYVIVRFPDSYYNWRYHIWFETVEGEDYTGKNLHTHNGRTYYEETVMEVRSSNTTDANQNEPQYEGFDYVTRLGQNNNGTVWQGGHWTTGNNPTLYHLNYIYNRQEYKITYFDGQYVDGNNNMIQNRSTHMLHESGLIGQGAHIADEYKNYVPTLPEGEVGYVFEGWYLDEGCTTPYTWDTMPVGGIRVYAKWRQIQYRVFLHPNAGTDPTLDWGSGSQAMNFRVSYGGQVSTPTGLRTEYEFVGWYLDEACTRVFNAEAYELNESTVTAAYNKDTDFTDPMDKWGNGATTNGDINRFWITKKLDLYAKWRAKLDGADGIGIVYDANGGSNAPTDTALYLDSSKAVAQAAPTPPSEDKQFLYWVVQHWNGTEYVDTNVTVFPGAKFDVLKSDARKEPVAGTEDQYTYTVQLKAVYGPKESPVMVGVYFDANGGEFDEGVTRVGGNIPVNTEITVPTSPTREGYEFLGWGLSPTDTEPWLQDGTTYCADGKDGPAWDATEEVNILYAIWKRTSCRVFIKKVVTGNMGDVNKDFTVTVTCDAPFTYNGTEYSASNPLVLTLKNDQTAGPLMIPYGAKLTVTEADYTGANGGYQAPVYTYNGTEITPTDYEITNDGTIVITNEKTIIPDTGVRMTSSPFAMLLTMTILGGTGLLVRRKKDQDDEE